MSQFVLHEIGHEIVAEIYNIDLDWKLQNNELRWEYGPEENNYNKLAMMDMAGLSIGIIPTELIIKNKIRNDYITGFVGFHVLNTFSYSLKYIFGKDNGDLTDLENNIGRSSANIFTAIITAISVHQSYKYFFEKNKKESNFNIIPMPNGIGLEIKF